jgi:membrane-associated phospholipid phosphatase
MPLVESVAKPLFDRRMDGDLSYPSGHTAVAVSLLTVAALYLAAGRARPVQWIVLGLWLSLTTSVAVGLVAMDYHYPTDTLGGVCLAVGIVLPSAVLADLLASVRQRGRIDDELESSDNKVIARLP